MTYIKTDLQVKEELALAKEVERELEQKQEEKAIAELLDEQSSTIRRVQR